MTKEKVHILEDFHNGAVSAKLFSNVLNEQESFLKKIQFILDPAYDPEDAIEALVITEDLCSLFSRKCEDFWKKGERQIEATRGKFDLEKSKGQALPGLIEGCIECEIVGLNPTKVLWDAIRKHRAEAEEEEDS